MTDRLVRHRLPYHYWKFHAAVSSLATSHQPLRQRILYARMSYPAIQAKDLPDEIRETFEEIDRLLTTVKDGDPNEGEWANTVAAMSDEEATEVADLMLKLFNDTLTQDGD